MPGLGRRLPPRLRRSLLRRVAFTFAVSVALAALALALAAYYLTESSQDNRALTGALDQSRQNLTVADAMLPVHPSPSDYEALMPAFQIRGDFDTLMETGSEIYVSGPDVTRAPVTDELAAKVGEGNIRYQKVGVDGEPTIVVGSELRAGELTVYFFYPQGERLAGLTRLRNILITAAVLLAALGAITRYLLARRLLSPVRAASGAAVQMSHGNLHIRLPKGSDEFGVLAASSNQMAEKLQAKMLDLEAGQARERRFVADVTHELRTPVSALVGEASLLKAKLDASFAEYPTEVSRLAELVTQDIGRLRQLVDDLLEISRLEAQAAETVIEPVGLDSFLAQLVRAHGWSETVRVVAPSKGGPPARHSPIEETPPASESPLVLADKRRLERIMVNLIQNALRHGVAPVTLELRSAAAAASEGHRLLEVAVTDSGPGIPVEHVLPVFDRFYKADPSRSSSRGSGLGLAIARENARLLGGDITAANVPGGGARFVVALPAAHV